MFQSFNLIPTLTVAENVELPLALNDVAPAEVRRRSRELLAELGPRSAAPTDFPRTFPAASNNASRSRAPSIHEPKLVVGRRADGQPRYGNGAPCARALAAHVRRAQRDADRRDAQRRAGRASGPRRDDSRGAHRGLRLVTGLLRRASLRFYLRHPWQLVLAIAGISLGVAVYVGVSLANDSAARAFDVAAGDVRGTITHRLLPLDGALDERCTASSCSATVRCRRRPSSRARSGIAGRPGLRFPLLGIDPLLGERALRMAQVAPAGGTDIVRLVIEPGTVLLPEGLAGELGIASGGFDDGDDRAARGLVRVLGLIRFSQQRRSSRTADRGRHRDGAGTACDARPHRPNRPLADGGSSASARCHCTRRRRARGGGRRRQPPSAS